MRRRRTDYDIKHDEEEQRCMLITLIGVVVVLLILGALGGCMP